MTDQDDCIFCQIVAGDIPSHTVYEDDETFAFLDVNPVSDGHTLVIPKTHEEHITGLSEDTSAALFRTVNKVAKAVENAVEPAGMNLLQNNGDAAGQEIGHVHVHIIPRYAEDGFEFSFDSDELADDRAATLKEELSRQL